MQWKNTKLQWIESIANFKNSYEYEIDKRENYFKMIYAVTMTVKKMFQNIFEKEDKGIDQTHIKLSLEKFFKEQPTVGGFEIFKQLFAEANAQVGLLKLPHVFLQYREIIYK